ncbi:MAG: hypothetical protein QXS69_03175, partial [Candidatus Aenigmatarchaeota archaeon]
MVNKRFQKFLFLLLAIVTFLSFTILPVFSEGEKPTTPTTPSAQQPTTPSAQREGKLLYYMGLLVGVICIMIGIAVLIGGGGLRGAML